MIPALALVQGWFNKLPAKVRGTFIGVLVVSIVLSWALQIFDVPLPWDKIEELITGLALYVGVQSLFRLTPDAPKDWFDPADYQAELETTEDGEAR